MLNLLYIRRSLNAALVIVEDDVATVAAALISVVVPVLSVVAAVLSVVVDVFSANNKYNMVSL